MLPTLAAGLLSALSGLGCFMDPVNRPPVVTSLAAAVPVVRGEPAWFTATVSDPDSDQGPITPTWAYVPMTCPSDTSRANWPTNPQPLPAGMQEFMVPADATRDPFCVWVFATDRYGAVDVEFIQVDPTNRPPTAKIDVSKPDCIDAGSGPATTCVYPLYSDFSLSAAGSLDRDGDTVVDYNWALDRSPSGSVASLGACASGGPATRCFSADRPGLYVVSLVVHDSLGAAGSETLTLAVADDRSPCIAASTPGYTSTLLVHNPMAPTTFVIDHVDDDGDPYPAGAHGLAHFRWFVSHGDEPLVYQDNDFPSLDLAPGPFLGETSRVRVEILDRSMHTKDILFGCGDAPLCEARPGCFLRVTWTIEYLQ
jgi:hypothetical protein